MTAARPSRRGVLVAAAAAGLAACSADDASGPAHPTPSPAPTSPAPTASASAATSPTAADWAQLGRSVRGSLVLPADKDYDQVRLLENPRYDAQRPLAVLSVRSPRDVSTALGFAQDHAVPVAIRSGGHSYPGWSGGGAPSALVVDCRPIAGVRLDGDTATIGAGAALAQVYDALGSRGRAIAGGSCATVGIAGLTLGGGVGVLTRAMGLTCDAVTAIEVVTADGQVRRADAQDEPDLFWALRGGGGGHLGVVTSFEFATSPAPHLESAYLQWPISAAGPVIDAWQSWLAAAPPELWATLKALGGAKHPSGPIVLVSATWTGRAGAFDAQLAGLLDQVPTPSVTARHGQSYLDAMMFYAGCASVPVARCTTGPGGALTREAFGATSSVAYHPLDAAGIEDLVSHVEDAQSSGLLEAGVSIDALGGKVADVAAGETAFVHRTALATVQYTATFPPGGPQAAGAYVRGFRSAMGRWWGNHAYVNYADAAIRDYRDAYFGANAARLAQVRDAYDPDGFFTQPQDY